MKLQDIKNKWEEFIVLKDHLAVDVILGTIIANQLLDLDPVWLMMISQSSGGKSTLLAPCVDIKGVHFVDDLTEKTLLSGYKVGGKDNSLLRTIGSGMMIFSDFSSILSKNPISKGEILSQLRLVYDRKLTKYTGTGKVNWAGKIGVLAGATPSIYFHLESGQAMGERWAYWYLQAPSDEEMSTKQSQTKISAKDMTDIMKEYYKDFYDGVKEWTEKNGVPELKMTNNQKERVRKASMFCVSGKATTHIHWKSGKIDQIPDKASVGRDFKSYHALLVALQLMYCYETGNKNAGVQDFHIDIIEKCAYSSLNRERRMVLEILANSSKSLSASQIGSSRGFGLTKEGVEIYLNPLFAVGLIKRDTTSSNAFKWFMEKGSDRDFVNEMTDIVPQVKLKVDEPGVETTEADEDFDNF